MAACTIYNECISLSPVPLPGIFGICLGITRQLIYYGTCVRHLLHVCSTLHATSSAALHANYCNLSWACTEAASATHNRQKSRARKFSRRRRRRVRRLHATLSCSSMFAADLACIASCFPLLAPSSLGSLLSALRALWYICNFRFGCGNCFRVASSIY